MIHGTDRGENVFKASARNQALEGNVGVNTALGPLPFSSIRGMNRASFYDLWYKCQISLEFVLQIVAKTSSNPVPGIFYEKGMNLEHFWQ